MRVLIDVLGSTAQSGGMRLHATEVVRSWAELFPADQVIIAGPRWAVGEFADLGIDVRRWSNDNALVRATGQVFFTAYLARRLKLDAVVSLSPVVTPLAGAFRPRLAVDHDWRHIKAPHQFGRLQLLYRSLWRQSARWATSCVCISDKTAAETRILEPRANVVVVPNGEDHTRRWASRAKAIPGRIVAFGHHDHKRVELLLMALPLLRRRADCSLTVLGSRGAYDGRLRALATRLRVDDITQFSGFVDDAAYQMIVASANVVALMSNDEGFGLPIAEARSLGIPALVASDCGIAEIFSGYAAVADPEPSAIADTLAAILADGRPRRPQSVRTWAQVAAEIRTIAASANVTQSRPRSTLRSLLRPRARASRGLASPGRFGDD